MRDFIFTVGWFAACVAMGSTSRWPLGIVYCVGLKVERWPWAYRRSSSCLLWPQSSNQHPPPALYHTRLAPAPQPTTNMGVIRWPTAIEHVGHADRLLITRNHFTPHPHTPPTHTPTPYPLAIICGWNSYTQVNAHTHMHILYNAHTYTQTRHFLQCGR